MSNSQSDAEFAELLSMFSTYRDEPSDALDEKTLFVVLESRRTKQRGRSQVVIRRPSPVLTPVKEPTIEFKKFTSTRLSTAVLDSIQFCEDDLIKEFNDCLDFRKISSSERTDFYLLDEIAKKEMIYFYHEDLGKEQQRIEKEKSKEKKLIQKTERKVEQTAPLVILDAEYTGWTINFNSVFLVNEMKVGFLNHLKKEFNTEPFEFLLEVEKMPHDSTKETVKLFLSIVDRFIFDHSENPLNISGRDRKEVLEIRNGIRNYLWTMDGVNPVDVLEGCRKSIYIDLRGESFPRFIYSPEGYKVIQDNVSNPYVISRTVNEFLDEKFSKMKLTKSEIKEYGHDLKSAKNFQSRFFPKSWQSEFRDTTKIPFKIALIEDPNKKPVGFKSLFVGNSGDGGNFFYAGLIIGPFILEWKETGLCLPREYNPAEGMVTFDVNAQKEFTIGDFKAKIDKLCFNITRWNHGRSFHLTKKGDHGNSQDFVESQLITLGTKLIISSHMMELLSCVKMTGNTKLRFNPQIEFNATYNLKLKSYKFKKHEALDEFVEGLLDVNPTFADDHPYEWELFKKFDRFFWLKFLTFEKQRKEVRTRNAVCGKGFPLITCPFKHVNSILEVDPVLNSLPN